MNRLLTVLVASLLLLVQSASASTIKIKWEGIGGLNTFGAQATSFTPIVVESLIRIETYGHWENGTNSANSTLTGIVNFNIGGSWLTGATHDIRGVHLSTVKLDNWNYQPIDFSVAPLMGIIVTNSIGGSGHFSAMNAGNNDFGTEFVFATTPVPIPSSFILFLGPFMYFCVRYAILILSNR